MAPKTHYLKAISVCTEEEVREMVRAARSTVMSLNGFVMEISGLAGIK